ncbi:MAG: DUF4465 domain-containing protein [Rikenellaceae bacterium]|nr:DUF4465 domain-containing protein [Rikenellaceae bacterium]
MKKLLSIMAIAALMVGCSKEDSTTDVATATFTLTGYTSNNTRTEFGTPNDEWTKIPFLWSEGDKIWSGSEQSSEATINDDGSASFTFTSEPTTTIYYNMTGSSAAEANVPATQSIANNLGQNGDFGYATVEDGKFALNHATAYLGFFPILIDDSDPDERVPMTNAKIVSITIDAADGIIAGKANWTGENFSTPTNGSSKITLNINEVPDYDNLIFYPAVVLPTNLTGKTIKFTYELSVDGKTKYYTATRQGIELIGGVTYDLPEEILLSQLTDYRELRVLTFEDNDAKFEKYTLGYCGAEINTWSNLIVGEDEQAYGTSGLIYDMNNGAEYWWQDSGNTELYHKFPYNWGGYGFSGGGAAISRHTVTVDDLNNAADIYQYQLSITANGGHNNSSNFCVVYNDSAVNTEAKSELSFSDGVARVIDHMYVTMVAPTQYCVTYGNSFSEAYDEDDFLNIVATGYNGDTKIGEVTFELAKGADKKVTDWAKWDLSSLGKVTKVTFHMEEAQIDDYGYAQYYKTPMYFAFDDVAVQF